MTNPITVLTDVLGAVRDDRGLPPDRPAVEAAAAAVIEKLALLGYELVATGHRDELADDARRM